MHRVNTDLQQVGPLHLNYVFQFSVLMGYLGVQISGYQILGPFLGGSFFLLVCFVQPQYVFILSFLFCFNISECINE